MLSFEPLSASIYTLQIFPQPLPIPRIKNTLSNF